MYKARPMPRWLVRYDSPPGRGHHREFENRYRNSQRNTIPIQFLNTTPRAHDMIGSSNPNSMLSKVRDRARRQTEPQWHMTSAEEAGFEHPGKVPILRVGLRWGHRIRLIADGIWVCKDG
ncbi:uncharacterized protein B0T23DRAFT_407402 [Neurospora hispaniola]|uniref:Uncharacterized protein n=1 Tax=Neurospora hispaniola TaxID=588809 RepID=A0AAJ0I0K3_9PEZI|nr:hypothetical protein B0T23DRAFT_407402 [Neurospora hispaniola]